MKTFLLIIQLFALCSAAFSQCPPSAMKIQSPICDTPRNLKAVLTCTTAKLNWKGNNEQTYIVNATGTDADSNTIFEIKEAKYSCDENGNCAATISVKQGVILNWNVQAICNINSAQIYSPVVQDKQTTIPACNAVAQNAKKDNLNGAIRVYPNPTTGKLTVEYNSNDAGNIHLIIYNLTGKKILSTTSTLIKGNNSYQLNLANLSQGTYYIELSNTIQSNRVKFVIQR